MVWILLFVALQDVAQLEDDDPAVRDDAAATLAEKVEALERALAHESLEVRSRAADLLARRPEYVYVLLRNQPEFDHLKRLWNAAIDAVVRKRPVPLELWERTVDRYEPQRERTGRAISHSAVWMARALRDEGERVLRRLAERYGVEGREKPAMEIQRAVAWRSIPRLSERLAHWGADEATFDEVTAGVLHLRDLSGEHVAEFSEEDWNVFARFLVEIRRRPGAPAAAPPATREAAIERVCRGPWFEGIVDGLGRAFACRNGIHSILEELEKESEETQERTPWAELEDVYQALQALDREIGIVYFHPTALEHREPALPARITPIRPAQRDLFDRVRNEGELGHGPLRVVSVLLPLIQARRTPDVTARLLRTLAFRVAARVESRE